MPINPKYAAVIDRNKQGGGGNFEKFPKVWLNNVGDALRGTVTRVSDVMQFDNKHPGKEGQKVDTQFVDLKDVTVRRLDGDKGEFVEETFPEATFMMNKGGHFEAVYDALVALEEETTAAGQDSHSDIPIGGDFAIRRGTNDDKRHTFKVKLGSPIPF